MPLCGINSSAFRLDAIRTTGHVRPDKIDSGLDDELLFSLLRFINSARCKVQRQPHRLYTAAAAAAGAASVRDDFNPFQRPTVASNY